MAFGPIHTETQINRFLETATGGIDVAQGLALARYASAVEDGDIVEIGSYKGKSAVAIAYGMGQSANSDRIQLFCIDPHATFTGQLGGKFNAQDRGDFFKVMLETGTYQNVALINLPCDQVALGWTRPIGMLFIDGDHRYHVCTTVPSMTSKRREEWRMYRTASKSTGNDLSFASRPSKMVKRLCNIVLAHNRFGTSGARVGDA